jgi:hypothetical protein
MSKTDKDSKTKSPGIELQRDDFETLKLSMEGIRQRAVHALSMLEILEARANKQFQQALATIKKGGL